MTKKVLSYLATGLVAVLIVVSLGGTAVSAKAKSKNFSLLDVTSDMIDVGIYAVGEDNSEIVLPVVNTG